MYHWFFNECQCYKMNFDRCVFFHSLFYLLGPICNLFYQYHENKENLNIAFFAVKKQFSSRLIIKSESRVQKSSATRVKKKTFIDCTRSFYCSYLLLISLIWSTLIGVQTIRSCGMYINLFQYKQITHVLVHTSHKYSSSTLLWWCGVLLHAHTIQSAKCIRRVIDVSSCACLRRSMFVCDT